MYQRSQSLERVFFDLRHHRFILFIPLLSKKKDTHLKKRICLQSLRPDFFENTNRDSSKWIIIGLDGGVGGSKIGEDKNLCLVTPFAFFCCRTEGCDQTVLQDGGVQLHDIDIGRHRRAVVRRGSRSHFCPTH